MRISPNRAHCAQNGGDWEVGLGITREAVGQVLEPLAEGFRSDGADLAVDEASDQQVTVRLVTSPATCLECIMPADVITRVLETAVRESFPQLGRFVFVDSRE